MNKRKDGFTLAELLVVVAIIGVLVAISIPIFTSQREKARTAVCMANRRSLKAVLSADKMFDLTNGFIELTDEQKKEFTCPDGGKLSAAFSDGSVGVFCSITSHNDGDTTVLNKVTTDVIETYISNFLTAKGNGIINKDSTEINSDYRDKNSETKNFLNDYKVELGPIDEGNWKLTSESFIWTPTINESTKDIISTFGIRYKIDATGSKIYEVVSIKLGPSSNGANPKTGRINSDEKNITHVAFYSSYSEALAALNEALK